MKRLIAIMCAAATLSAATTTASANQAVSGINTTGANFNVVAPAVQYSEETCAVFTTAPPAAINLAAKAPNDVGKSELVTQCAVPPAEDADRVVHWANLVGTDNRVPAPEDIGKAAATVGICDTYGAPTATLGGGSDIGTVIVTC